MKDLKELVFAVERGYVAGAMGKQPVDVVFDGIGELFAATGAVASRYLAVGTPRSIGLIGSAEDAARSLAAHRTWFAPTDVRCTAETDFGRVVSIDEALAADIVCVHEPVAIAPRQLRRGTHVNILVLLYAIDPELARIAVVSRAEPDLGRLAAGLVDGRQLDEITIFAI